MHDPSHILESDSMQVKENLSFEMRSIKIFDSHMKQQRGRDIIMIKVLWDLTSSDSTWEIEEDIQALYPNMLNFLGRKFL